MNNRALNFVNIIVNEVYQKEQNNLSLNTQMFLYKLIEIQLDQGPSGYTNIFNKIKYSAQLTSDCMEQLKNIGIVEMVPVHDTFIYEVVKVAEEIPCI